MHSVSLSKIAACGLFLVCVNSSAAVRLARVFRDHMVLQRQMPVPVWGWADPREQIEVRLGNSGGRTTAGQDGFWLVRLAPLKPGGPFSLVVRGTNTVELQDVLVGEVWLCAGQSNMVWPVHKCLNAEDEIAAANHPRLRLLQVPRRPAEQPRADLGRASVWQPCTSESVKGFSGTAYFFGRHLLQKLDVPIGLINSSVGGTSIEFWISCRKLGQTSETSAILQRYEQAKPHLQTRRAAYRKKMARWQEAKKSAEANGKPPSKPPRAPHFVQPARRPAALFNGMVYPLIPFAIRGVIWYQGESGGEPYGKLLPALITDWRTRWGQGDFPFCVGQLHNVRAMQTDPNEKCLWNARREAQLRTAQRLPNVGLTVAIDIGLPHTTHYPNKQEVGRRFALWALGAIYGRTLTYSGPVFRDMSVEGNRVRLTFEHTGDELTAKGGELKGFVVAGKDRKFTWADARIDGKSVLVWSDDVPKPQAVRYGWAANPACTLYNSAGLPASPFRTDNW